MRPLFSKQNEQHNLGLIPGRLVYNEKKSDNQEAEKPKTERELAKEKVKEWKELTRDEKPEARVDRLEKQLDNKNGFALDHLNKQAQAILKRGNPDEIEYLDYQLNGTLSEPDIYEFGRGLEEIRKNSDAETDADETKELTTDNVIQLDNFRQKRTSEVRDILESLPTSSTGDWSQEVEEAVVLNKEDEQKTNEIIDLIKESGISINPKQLGELLNLDPNQDDYPIKVDQVLSEGFSSKNADFLGQFRALHKEKQKKAEAFETKSRAIFDKLSNEMQDHRQQSIQKMAMEQRTGLPVEAGTELQFTTEEGRNGVARIKDVKWENKLSPETTALLNEQGIANHKQLYVEVEQTVNGETTTEIYNIKKFHEWANHHVRPTEKILDKADLESRLKLSKYGQTLSSGDQLEFRAGSVRTGLEVKTETVGIESIDEAKQTIILDRPVQYLQNKSDNSGAEALMQDRRQQLSFGEFARWWRLHNAEHQLDKTAAQNVLNELAKTLKADYPDLDLSEEPIKLEPGFKIDDGNHGYITINNVDDNGIELSNGEKMPLSQFVRTAKAAPLSAYPGQENPESTDVNEDSAEEPGEMPNNVELFREAPLEITETELKTAEEMPELAGGRYPGLIQDFWNNVQFLSLEDVYRMGEVTIDFFTRNWERYSKRKVGDVGGHLPGRLGREFEVMNQEAEDEAVNKYKGALEDINDWGLKDRLYASGDEDEVKACLLLLIDRGLLRFDDPKLWKVLNRLLDNKSGGFAYSIPIEKYKDEPDKAKDLVIRAIDRLYGEPTGTDYFNQADNNYNSKVEGFKSEANDFENQYLGHNIAAELHNMLLDHVNDKYVTPHRYAQFIDFIMYAGKAEVEDKFYYVLQGLIQRNSRGETLLSKRDVAKLNGKYSNQLPWLDFFTRVRPFPDQATLPDRYVNELANAFEMYPRQNTNSKGKRYNAAAVNQFIWQDALTFGATHTRVSKGLRGAEKMDHDDAHFIIPLATQTDMLGAVLNVVATSRSQFTKDGFKNGVAGFSMMFAAAAANPSKEENQERADTGYLSADDMLAQMIPSYLTYYNGIVGKMNLKIEAFTPGVLEKETAGVDGTLTIGEHFRKMNTVVEKVLDAYGLVRSEEERDSFFGEARPDEDGFKEKQQKTDALIRGFDRRFQAALKTQGTDKLVNIMREAAQSGQLSGVGKLGPAVAKRKSFANYWESGWTGAGTAKAA